MYMFIVYLFMQIKDILEQFGLVVISRFGSNPEQFIYQSDQLFPLKVCVLLVGSDITRLFPVLVFDH